MQCAKDGGNRFREAHRRVVTTHVLCRFRKVLNSFFFFFLLWKEFGERFEIGEKGVRVDDTWILEGPGA